MPQSKFGAVSAHLLCTDSETHHEQTLGGEAARDSVAWRSWTRPITHRTTSSRASVLRVQSRVHGSRPALLLRCRTDRFTAWRLTGDSVPSPLESTSPTCTSNLDSPRTSQTGSPLPDPPPRAPSSSWNHLQLLWERHYCSGARPGGIVLARPRRARRQDPRGSRRHTNGRRFGSPRTRRKIQRGLEDR